jgi:hypothetical protein
LNKLNELDFEINKELLNKFKRTQVQEERDNSVGKNIKSDGLSASKKLELLINGNNSKQAPLNKDRIGNKEYHNKKNLETFQNQLNNFHNSIENSSNNLNIGIVNQNEKIQQKVLSEKGNINNNPVRSFLYTNLEKVNIRVNPEHKYNII